MPALRRYTIWIVEVLRDHTHSFRVFDGMFAKVEADEYEMVCRKQTDSSGKPVRVEKWEMTEEKAK